MQLLLPPEHFRTKINEKEFLKELDKRLHYVTESWAETNISRSRHKLSIDHYTNQKINSNEIEKILSLINLETGIAMTPINTDRGFSVGFSAIYTFDKKTLLCFLENQLPEGYNFKRLSRTFNSSDNIEMLKSIGIETPKEYWHYCY